MRHDWVVPAKYVPIEQESVSARTLVEPVVKKDPEEVSHEEEKEIVGIPSSGEDEKNNETKNDIVREDNEDVKEETNDDVLDVSFTSSNKETIGDMEEPRQASSVEDNVIEVQFDDSVREPVATNNTTSERPQTFVEMLRSLSDEEVSLRTSLKELKHMCDTYDLKQHGKKMDLVSRLRRQLLDS